MRAARSENPSYISVQLPPGVCIMRTPSASFSCECMNAGYTSHVPTVTLASKVFNGAVGSNTPGERRFNEIVAQFGKLL